MKSRLDTHHILDLAEKTGASAGGTPIIGGRLDEKDVLSSLRLMVKKISGIEIPIINNGLGYNNLIYVSLILAKLKMITSSEYGENAKIFPILLIEEPEAHLHPALQYNFLRFLRDEINRNELSRQVFITTHSTHITAAVDLDSVICLDSEDCEGHYVAYPGKVFSTSVEDLNSKKYIQRYLDATKSSMLFAKSIVLAEGMAEQLLLPILADYHNHNFEKNHVSLVRVDSLTFKHFVKMFGAGIASDRAHYAIRKRIACVIDTDPSRKRRIRESGERLNWKKCWPFELGLDNETFEYKPLSGAVQNLVAVANDEVQNVKVFYNRTEKGKTFEYDFALLNPEFEDMFMDVEMENINSLEQSGLAQDEKIIARKAASYLLHVENEKGEAAFDLAEKLKNNMISEQRVQIVLPQHIRDAIDWACYSDGEDLLNAD